MNHQIIYKYVNNADGLRILSENTLKFSSPHDFNDPFDCYEELIKFDLTKECVEYFVESGSLILTEEDKKLTSVELLEKLEKVYDFENSVLKDIFFNLKSELWISCFSKKYNEILMWSHYADKHKGFCIGFNLDGLAETFDFILSEVNYPEKFTKVDYCANPKKALEHFVSTKAKNWIYEEEIRLRTNKENIKFIDNTVKGITKISPNSISEIHIGNKNELTDCELNDIVSKYGDKSIQIKRMELDENDFSLKEIECT
ncbi:MAG: DUF2971 domain-containing protein [Bacteroidales bacterium]|nr:DUF2971 domain-containing protein [Bacteroidales bacterium]